MSTTDVRERFLRDIAEHEMTIELDHGVHRSLLFKKSSGSFMYHFRLNTWPGHLSITGDMGGYTFQRIDDMFKFFRTGGSIDHRYWAEKLASSGGKVQTWSPELFTQQVNEYVDDWIEWEDLGGDRDEMTGRFRKSHAKLLREAVAEQVLAVAYDQHEAMEALRYFEWTSPAPVSHYDPRQVTLRFEDTWGWGDACLDYSYHFRWCCEAIRWGVQRYDAQAATA